MYLPKISIPSTLQASAMQVAKPHYEPTQISSIAIATITMALNENLITQALFEQAQSSKKALIDLSELCAKRLTLLSQRITTTSYDCFSLNLNYIAPDAVHSNDDAPTIGIYINLTQLLPFNLSIKTKYPKSLITLSQKIALFISESFDCINGFLCQEQYQTIEYWDHLTISAKKLNTKIDYDFYKILYANDGFIEDKEEFDHFVTKMKWYDKAVQKGGIGHSESSSVEEYIKTLCAKDKTHPLFKALMSVYDKAIKTSGAFVDFKSSNTVEYEEDCAPLFYGFLAYANFNGEEETINEHVNQLNETGEEIKIITVPNSPFALTKTIKFLNDICNFNNLCNSSLNPYTNEVSI